MSGETIFSVSIVNETPINASRIAHLTTREPVLSKVVKFVKTSWPRDVGSECSPCMRRKGELSVEQGCLLRVSRVVIPAPGRETLLDELHECHPGIVRMKASARSYVWGQDLMQKLKARFVVASFAKNTASCHRTQICTHGNGQVNSGIVYTLTILVH